MTKEEADKVLAACNSEQLKTSVVCFLSGVAIGVAVTWLIWVLSVQ